MMNRSSNPVDPYVPSIMSFVGLEGNTTVPTQKSHLWDWETNNHAQNHSHPIPTTNSTPFFDPPPSLFPINNFPLYSSPFAAEYPAGIIKREEGGGGRIGLNLGHRTYFSSGDALTLDRLFAARAQHHQQPRCQVEGCKADLSGAKHYHRRHKVCEFHSKAIVVIAGGTQQRFCQQCSRFHVLAEFDEAKRSCRKRLADHNRRRRKPQNPSTNSTEKTKHTPKPSRDICTTSKSTTTTPAISTANSGFEGEHGNLQNRNIILRNEPALSLGGVGGSHHSLYQHFSSPSTNNFFYHQSLIGSSSNEASQSTEGGSDHHHQSNLLHLGQAMFEVDFM